MNLVSLVATILLATPALFATSTLMPLATPAVLAADSDSSAAPAEPAEGDTAGMPGKPKPAPPSTLLKGGSPSDPAFPIVYPPSAAEAIIKSIYKERERSEKWFQSKAESFLGAVERKDFAGKSALTIGSAADNDLQVKDALFRPHHMRVTLVGDSFHVEALDDSALFLVMTVETRDTTLGPSVISVGKQGELFGRYEMRFWQQRQPAVMLFDIFSPRFSENRGLKHFPVDLKYRFALQMEPNPKADTISVTSTRGPARPAVRLGWFNFMIGKTPCRVSVLRLFDPGLPPDYMAVFFRDATSGKETPALGRYAEVRQVGKGKYLLDFNNAKNPACAFSNLYNCVIPPKENTLKVPILAGEKDLGYLSASKR